ncbi:MAG: division/cell wall cluster transcriptional repressor MraZ [bacterium]
MSSFYGEYSYSLDGKNRVFVPARFRDELKKEKETHFMLTIGLDRCLYIFLPSRWENLLANNLEAFKSANKEDERAFKRFFFGNAVETPVDEQGRILVPQNHKAHAFLKKNVIIRGVGNKAELWDAQRWENYNKEVARPSFEKFGKIFDL